MFPCIYMRLQASSTKVVNTVLVPTSTYTDIKILTIRINLNTGRTNHVPANFEQYRSIQKKKKKKSFWVIFEFCKSRIITYLH